MENDHSFSQYMTYLCGIQLLDMFGESLICLIENLGHSLCFLSVSKTSFLFLLFQHRSEVGMCWTDLKFTYRPCLFSQPQATASLRRSMDRLLNRIREIFLIAYNSCVLIIYVSSYCASDDKDFLQT